MIAGARLVLVIFMQVLETKTYTYTVFVLETVPMVIVGTE